MNGKQLAERFLADNLLNQAAADYNSAVNRLERAFGRFVRGILNEDLFAVMPRTPQEKFEAIELVHEMYNELQERLKDAEKERLRIRTLTEELRARKLKGLCVLKRRWEEKWAQFSSSENVRTAEDLITLLNEKLEEVEFTFELELLAYEVRTITRGDYLISGEVRAELRRLLRTYGEAYGQQELLGKVRGLDLYTF
ncbi:hypothetical protein [Paenibacillus sp. y28]|uniref:hypothetical protein n=1 Tax=Paenibacillus sp. y28 TaxID=3129110 RepID=UPI0030169CEC